MISFSGRPMGLWRSPVAHLVRIEGVRGSNPLSSTTLSSTNPIGVGFSLPITKPAQSAAS